MLSIATTPMTVFVTISASASRHSLSKTGRDDTE
jgi:hypothetical protein